MTCGNTAECGGLLKCIDQVCTNPNAPDEGGRNRGSDKWEDFQIDGVHGFVALDLAGGPSMVLDYDSGQTSDVSGSFVGSIKGGIIFGAGELGAEFSPMTFFPYTEFGEPNLSLLGFVGARLPITDVLHYSMRFGLGMVAVNTPGDQVFFQQRLDILGFGFRTGHLLFDFHMPSFRHMTDLDQGSIFVWQPGAAATYAF